MTCYNKGMARRRKSRWRIFWGIILFVVIFGFVFLGFQYLTKTGIFRIPGVVYYDESLNEQEREILQGIFTEDIVLEKDVKIRAEESQTRPELKEGQILEEILVPVTDFYEERSDVNEFEEEVKYIPIEELTFEQKLLAINGKYYFDDFTNGAIFRTIVFESENYQKEIEPLVKSTFAKDLPEKSNVLTFAQTGVTALSRGMNAKLEEVGGDATYFAQKIGDYLVKFDLLHTSNESSFTDLATSENICSDKRFIDTLTTIGLDIVELTGNHNRDCGDQAAIDTIDLYAQQGIKVVGGGKTASDAAKPLTLNEKNTGITFLAYNLSTGGATLDETPGANQYAEENAVTEIRTAKERGDFVIVDVQYYECSAYASKDEDPTCDYANSAAGDQIGFFRHLIDLGADLVVGTSAHQPQTFELYGSGAIYYGLGNLFFDQVWWPGTTRSLILEHYFYNGKLLQTRITPTIYDESLQPELLNKDKAQVFLKRLIQEKP